MDSQIKEDWEVALNILKPSKKELEKGIKIHKEAIVWDSYGFAPISTINGDIVKAAIEEGASITEIRDLIEEMQMTGCITSSEERKK